MRTDNSKYRKWKDDRLRAELPAAAIDDYTASKMNACMLSTDIMHYYNVYRYGCENTTGSYCV